MPTVGCSPIESLRDLISRHWGFAGFRPLQEEAMRAVLSGRDSLVVMPTGGGKSLCYQAPAVLRGDTTIVVSPLIALMKDQVDSLRTCGVAAARIDSLQAPEERAASESDLVEGRLRLLFVSPERLVMTSFQWLLRQARVTTFAIDEAHCISHWGHDFRPEYRQLRQLKEIFPTSGVHAYTATATERVRRDIVEQLGLVDPEVLVGNFDRPNLTYRVVSRRDLRRQVLDVIRRHRSQPGIIYCIRRSDVDELCAALQKQGFRARAYHAGLSADLRRAAQDAFAAEECDLMVATVAFGMGIDRSDIRFVLHAAMPKSLEHYQQETGRAGRDGLDAECVLLHSGADFFTWKSIIEKSGAEPGVDPNFVPSALRHLDDMDRYCRGAACRHRTLVEHFDQPYKAESCDACDLCLGETETMTAGPVVAQKILSCVARLRERFGIGYVVSVLRGDSSDSMRTRGHHRLSTYGLLRDHPKADIREWIYQLLGQKVLVQHGSEYPVLRLNDASWEVMRGTQVVRLLQPPRRKPLKESKPEAVSWEGVDRELFEALRAARTRLARERAVPAYVVFSDATLRALARVRPTTPEDMRSVHGVGEVKLRDYGEEFLSVVRRHFESGQAPNRHADAGADAPGRTAFELFRQGRNLQEVMERTGKTRDEAFGSLCEYIRKEKPASLRAWIAEAVVQQVAATARQLGTERLEPLVVALGGHVSRQEIRAVLAHIGAGARLRTRELGSWQGHQ
jgi:ATP-dependent DNA helicase RecQ